MGPVLLLHHGFVEMFRIGVGSLMDLSGYVTLHRITAQSRGPLPAWFATAWVHRTRRLAWTLVGVLAASAAVLLAEGHPAGWAFAAAPTVTHAVLWALTRGERTAGRRLIHGGS